MHEVWVWGKGGYYPLLVGSNGTLGIPAGRQAWERFARYAPDDLIEKAVAAAEVGTDHSALTAGATSMPTRCSYATRTTVATVGGMIQIHPMWTKEQTTTTATCVCSRVRLASTRGTALPPPTGLRQTWTVIRAFSTSHLLAVQELPILQITLRS